jgi:archaellum component FlaC
MRKDLAAALKKEDLAIQKLQRIADDYKERIISLEARIRNLEKEIEYLTSENLKLKKKLKHSTSQ